MEARGFLRESFYPLWRFHEGGLYSSKDKRRKRHYILVAYREIAARKARTGGCPGGRGERVAEPVPS